MIEHYFHRSTDGFLTGSDASMSPLRSFKWKLRLWRSFDFVDSFTPRFVLEKCRSEEIWFEFFDYVCMNFVANGKKNVFTSSEIQLLEVWFSCWKNSSVLANSSQWFRNVKRETLVLLQSSLNIVIGWSFCGHTVEFKSWSWFVYWDCVGKRLQLKYSPTWWKLVKPRRGRKARWYHTIRWEVQERLKKDTTPRGWRDRLPTHVRCGGNSWRYRVRDGVEDRGRWSCLTYGHDHPSTRHACGFHDARGGDETFSSTDTIASTGFGGQCFNGEGKIEISNYESME